ncbi:MAG: hypothetical protein ACREVY_07820 [Gammaproteobacteria bacterium]
MRRLKFWKPYQIRDASIDAPLAEKSRYLLSILPLHPAVLPEAEQPRLGGSGRVCTSWPLAR